MSKLYQKYISLKINDNDTLYLFKSGIFFIFISEDARIAAPLLDLKLTNLNKAIKKCGFPVSASEKYFKKIETLNLNVKVVTLDDMPVTTNLDSFLQTQNILEIVDDFLKVNLDDISISQAFDLLQEMQSKLKNFVQISKDTKAL